MARIAVIALVGCASPQMPRASVGTPSSPDVGGHEIGAIRGRVRQHRQSDDQALTGVTVDATSASVPFSGTAITDKQGYYVIEHVPPADDYQVTFRYEGTAVAHDGVRVVAGRVTPLFQFLEPNKPHGSCEAVTGGAPVVCFP